jgi:hypothetical protein
MFLRRVKLNLASYAMQTPRGGYSSYSFLTSALNGVSVQRHAPAALYPLEKVLTLATG